MERPLFLDICFKSFIGRAKRSWAYKDEKVTHSTPVSLFFKFNPRSEACCIHAEKGGHMRPHMRGLLKNYVDYASHSLCFSLDTTNDNCISTGLEPRTSRIPCEHSDHWATEPHGRPVTISPCLIRFVPESTRNHAGTDETVPSTDPRWPSNVTGEEKAHGATGTWTQDLSHTVRALWPLSYRPLAYRASTLTIELPSQMGGGGRKQGP